MSMSQSNYRMKSSYRMEPAVMEETRILMRSVSHFKTPLISRLLPEGPSTISHSKMPLIPRLLPEGPSAVSHSKLSNIPSSHQDMVLNNSHSAYLYALYTPVAVKEGKKKDDLLKTSCISHMYWTVISSQRN